VGLAVYLHQLLSRKGAPPVAPPPSGAEPVAG
jgi:hypothetical protein